MERLLAEGDFVRALARRLIGGEDADDLAQEAWVQALRQPKPPRAPRAWFAMVLRRLASNRRRAQRHRAARESKFASSSVARDKDRAPSTSTVLACEEARRQVVEAVLALPEPFRSTVLATYYECLDAAAIARRDGVAIATVRSRLKRGLDRLRRALDSRHAGQRDGWAGPLAPLCGWDPPLDLPTSAVAMSSSKKLVLGAAAVLITGLSAWLATPYLRGEPATLPPPLESRTAKAQSSNVIDNRRDGIDARVAVGNPIAIDRPNRLPPRPPTINEPNVPVTVRVLDRATRQPVNGAEVRYLANRHDFDHPELRAHRLLHEAGFPRLLALYGSRAVTNRAGEASIRVPLSGVPVHALRAGEFASTYVRPLELRPGERPQLLLEDAGWLTLRVVDDDGVPLANRVLRRAASQPAASPLDGSAIGAGALTPSSDDDGLIRLRWPRDIDPVRLQPWTVGNHDGWDIDLATARAGVTELRYPTTGSVLVELRTPTGRLWPGHIRATIQPISGAGRRSPTTGPIGWRATEPGRYRIPHVELGQTLRANVSRLPYGTSFQQEFVGPTAADEEVVVVLTAEPTCEVMATAKLPAGDAVPANSDVAVYVRARGERYRHATCTPDENGTIRWPLPVGYSLQGSIEYRQRRGPKHSARWQVQETEAGVLELGTLALQAPNLLVAGTIDIGVDRWAGPPIALRVEAPTRQRSRWRVLSRSYVDPAVTRSFSILGTSKTDQVRLLIEPGAHYLAPEPIVVRPGTTDARVALQPCLALRAHVIAPAPYARGLVCIARRHDGAALPDSGDEDAPRNRAALVDFDGRAARFEWAALPLGAYEITVYAPGFTQPLTTVSGVHVRSDADPDSRLDPIDVRELAHTLNVSVIANAAAPRPLSDGAVAAWPEGNPGHAVHGLLLDGHGRAELLVAPGPLDVVVAVPGYRVWRGQGSAEHELQVRLETQLALPVRLETDLTTELAGYSVHVKLKPSNTRNRPNPRVNILRPGDRSASVHTSLDWLRCLATTGTAELRGPDWSDTIAVSAAGTFEVELVIRHPRGTIGVNSGIRGGHENAATPRFVEIDSGSTELVLGIDEDRLPHILDQLRKYR